MPRHKQPDLLDRFWASFSLRGILLHQATLFLVATVLVISGVVFLWENYQHTIADPTEFQLTSDKIELPPAPRWADADLRQLILNDDQPSILDPDLVSTAASKIRSVGFVENVNQIVKSKSGLKIDLQYRHPVAVIELSQYTFPKVWNEDMPDVYLPVDRQGVLMPRELADEGSLPKICMLYPANMIPGKEHNLTTWSDINDTRIQDAASIAQYFVNDAARIGIYRIVTRQLPEEAVDDLPFQLWPVNGGQGTIVIWGQPPGKEDVAEAPLEQKLVALENYVKQYGSLDEPRGITIDIRTGEAIVVPANKVAKESRDELF
ncbi:MAG: hypothetical protein AAFN77_01795 [Planctomycetota bacterium]